MFDFKKLNVYQKAKVFANDCNVLISNNEFDRHINDQLKRASFSIMLNIAEGSSRFGNKDSKNFLVIARGSAFECSAIFDFLYDNRAISGKEFQDFENKLEEISKILFALIKSLE